MVQCLSRKNIRSNTMFVKFKFFKLKTQTDKIQNGLIYLSLFLLISVAPDFSLVQEALFSSDAFKNFMDVLLPYDGKWFFH